MLSRILPLVALLLAPQLGFAQELDSGDTAWMLTSTALVLMMTIPGLALFYGGLVRSINIVNTLMQCFVICCLMTVVWFVAGYSIAFTDGNGWFGGLSKAFFAGVTMESMEGTIPEAVFAMFQMTFAIITPALIVGSFVERIKFTGLIAFIVLWGLFVYAPLAHQVWGGGIQSQMGVLDFAGGNVVHLNAGIAALIACLLVGKRYGYNEKRQELFSPNSIVLTMTGASLLWVGWFGFNAGSALGANSAAGMAMLNTQVATACAALGWMFSEWIIRGKPTLVGLSCGAVAGLVAITPAAGFVEPVGACIIGIASGTLCLIASYYLKEMFGYDDSLDVVGVHGMGGLVGGILVGVFAVSAVGGTAGGLEGNWAQVLIQLKGAGITMAYSAVVTFIILMAVHLTIGLRVAKKDEDSGLDLSVHGEKGMRP